MFQLLAALVFGSGTGRIRRWDGAQHTIDGMRLDDLPLNQRLLLRAYRWRRVEPVPRATLRTPLPGARIALVTTAGLVVNGDEPFDLDLRGGDPSFRVVPHDAADESLRVYHRSEAFDRTGLGQDLNVAFPRAILDYLARERQIGEPAARHLSFMGSITAPGRLLREVAPRAAEELCRNRVDVALLVPV